MYRVLLPVDADKRQALTQADAVSDLPEASRTVEVTLLRVFDDIAANEETEMVDPTRVVSVTEVSDRLDAEDVPFELRGAVGDTGDTILEVADEVDADLIVLGGPDRSPIGKAVFGSVGQYVLLNANRPVMMALDGSR
jgi:nucleotide-binding universal stress UspA family protein